jgi:hydroxymethylpyrimidine/phosphomethylpyrimidine kinase
VTSPPRVLTIAGSDSSAGAGLQADLITITAEGCRGATVVTAVTAQGPRGVDGWEPVSLELVRRQLVIALDELRPAAMKTGMLGTEAIIRLVVDELSRRQHAPLVCDPVAVATSGHSLVEDGALDAMRSGLFPRAALLTPNATEAAALSGLPVRTPEEAEAAGRELLQSGCGAVLVKGGHLTEKPGTDVLVTRDGARVFTAEAIDTPGVHGTGCVLSAAIASGLARGDSLEEAVTRGKKRVTAWIRERA